jgi:D-glycero-D-manno-heptose 1,7-bisphosphate phosphatase
MTATTKLFLFDLDGTLRQTKSGETFINKPEDQKPIAGAVDAVNYYCSKGFICVGITNQGGVAAKKKTLADTVLEQQITLSLIPNLTCIYFCPDFEGNSCWKIDAVAEKEIVRLANYPSFRKPGTGMVVQAVLDFELNLGSKPTEIWMTGDRPEDRQCAETANILFIWADVVLSKFTGEMRQPDLDSEFPITRFLSI